MCVAFGPFKSKCRAKWGESVDMCTLQGRQLAVMVQRVLEAQVPNRFAHLQ